jgi:hypothetical protein
MNIGDDLLPSEVRLIPQLVFRREDALASEMETSTIHEDVRPSYKIKTVTYKIWQVVGFNCPPKLVPVIIEVMKIRAD